MVWNTKMHKVQQEIIFIADERGGSSMVTGDMQIMNVSKIVGQ